MGRHYDLAIVGGGIVGLGHAVPAQPPGQTQALIDRMRAKVDSAHVAIIAST